MEIYKYTNGEIIGYLCNIGWTELIDARWERQVVKDIVEAFPVIEEHHMNSVLDTILVR